jgi:hypothetical protein
MVMRMTIGKIPVELGQLKELRKLGLNRNMLTGKLLFDQIMVITIVMIVVITIDASRR